MCASEQSTEGECGVCVREEEKGSVECGVWSVCVNVKQERKKKM